MNAKIQIFFVLFTLLAGASSSKTKFKKCCPPGEVFSGISMVDCVPAPEHATELYTVDYDNRNASGHTFPICDEPEDLSTTNLADLNLNDFQEKSSCVEIYYDANTYENTPIIAHCRLNKDRDERYNAPGALPRLLNVRRCCPKNTFFDERTADCLSILDVVPDGYYSDTDEFLSLLPKELDTVDFLNVTRVPVKCKGTTFTYEINARDIKFVDGALQVTVVPPEGKLERLAINNENACLELTPDFRTKRKLVVRVCRNSDLCQNNNCVRKCCPENVSLNRKRCMHNQPDSPKLFHETISRHMGADGMTEYGLAIGNKCQYGLYMLNPNEEWNMTREGFISIDPNYKVLKHNQYCVDVLYNATKVDELGVFVCFEKQIKEVDNRFIFTSILEAISCIFLLLTLMVYACLPVLQNLHGKTLMCHASSLFVGYFCLAIIPWVTPDRGVREPYATVFCSTSGFIMLFAFLSAFCWLNVMCFDIWRTFGRLRGTITRGRAHHKRFLFYCLYAWGLSMSITVIGILSDKTEFLPDSLRPNFGFAACWFIDQPGMYGELIFFRGPIAIQLTSNVVFFILTSERCSKVKAEIRRVADPLDPRSKRFHADKTKFIMNVKLFVVMGISWIAEIVSSFFKQYSNYEWQEQAFYATDVLNCLQGLLIFLLFVMKRRVHQALKKRLGFDRKKCSSQGTSVPHDPFKVKKSASNSTLTSSFAISSVP